MGVVCRLGLVSLLEFMEFQYAKLRHGGIPKCSVVLEHPKISLKSKWVGIYEFPKVILDILGG